MTELPKIFLTRGKHGCELAARLQAIAVVVDALRASVTIATLFDRGADRILVTAKVEDARALADTMPDAVLVGERGGERLPGFHLGNSPLEVLSYLPVDGKTVIFTSSNGAQRLTACKGASIILVGGMSNATVLTELVREKALAEHRPIVFISAGKYPDEAYISPEDEAVCTYLSTRLGLPIAEESAAYFAKWEQELILHGMETIFRRSRHAQRLMEIGYGDDVLHCIDPDTAPTLPVVTGDVMLAGRPVGVEVRQLAW